MSEAPKTPATYLQELVDTMIREVFAIVATEANQSSPEQAHALTMIFLQQFIGTCVVNSLVVPAEMMPPGASEAQKSANSWNNYQQEKTLIENAIGEGFRIGFMAYAPDTDPEMICQVLTADRTPSDPKISH